MLERRDALAQHGCEVRQHGAERQHRIGRVARGDSGVGEVVQRRVSAGSPVRV
jgi:hypothetical protein